MGILLVGIGGTRAGQNHAGLLAEGNYALCAAVKGVEAYEIAAVGTGVFADAEGLYLLVKSVQHCLELGRDDRSVLFHLSHKAVIGAEELSVTQLVDLVIADSLNGHQRFDVLHVLYRGSHYSHAAAGKGDL